MYILYCRIYQQLFKIVSFLLPWRQPQLISGNNSIKQVSSIIKTKQINKVLIVTDKVIVSLGLVDSLLSDLKNKQISYYVYDQTVPNPTIFNIEDALQMYLGNKCNAIIAIGGGSPIDCAKGVAAKIARPNKTLKQLKGILKVRKEIPTLIAIPTTSGTGSEATIAAVISNPDTSEKYAINDIVLTPHFAVLDPVLTLGLPPNITSTTGMDALTHAVEAYIGRSNTADTKKYSLEAIKLIFENIQECYLNGSNLVARKNMQQASYLAGLAFTRAYVGYVHAIAHTLGGFYNIPHGLANATILPIVLEYYGSSVYKQLADLAELVGITSPTNSTKEKAVLFIQAVKDLNEAMNIPSNISEIREKDIPLMVERALQEANPLYPVPKILLKEDLINLYLTIKG